MAIFDRLKRLMRGTTAQRPSTSESGKPGVAKRSSGSTRPEGSTIEGPESMMDEQTGVPQITPQEVWNQLEAGETLAFIDIRMPWDFQAMHPKGAEPLPINEIQLRLEELDRDKPYVLSCYHGYTSQDATAFLLQKGFKDVKSMAGGFSGWAAAGLPVEGKYRE